MGAGHGPCCQLQELQEGVHRLYSITDGKQEVDWSFFKTLQVSQPESSAASTEEAESMLVAPGNGHCCDGEGWKLVTSGTRRMAPAPSAAPEWGQCPSSRGEAGCFVNEGSELVA